MGGVFLYVHDFEFSVYCCVLRGRGCFLQLSFLKWQVKVMPFNFTCNDVLTV